MSKHELSESLQAVLKRLTQLALKDNALRDLLQNLAEDYLDATDELVNEDEGDIEQPIAPPAREQPRRAEPPRYENSDDNYGEDDYRPGRADRSANYGETRGYSAPRSYDAPPPRSYEPQRGGYDAPRGDASRGSYDSPARYDNPPARYDTPTRGGYDAGPRGGYEAPRYSGGRDDYEADRGGYDSGARGGYDDRGRGGAAAGWEQRPTRSDVEELTLIEDRCRLKAKGAYWAAERRRMINNGADFRVEIDPKDREIIALAKQIPECFLWMNHPSGPSPANLNLFDDLAGCFDSMADCAVFIREMLPEAEAFPEIFNKALDMAAEAQSALRAAVYRIDGPNDNDQNAVFHWLKRTASQMQIFIQRYMRADDTANPTKHGELSDRIHQLEKELNIARKKDRERAKHLSKVRPLIRDLTTVDEDNRDEHWRIIAKAVDEAINSGLPVTDSELRSLLSPLVKQVPPSNDYPEGFLTVLSEYEQSSLAPAPAPVENESL